MGGWGWGSEVSCTGTRSILISFLLDLLRVLCALFLWVVDIDLWI